jgi:predicted ATPase
VHWLRRDVTAQREWAAKTIALSEAQGFPLWLGFGKTFHAATRAAGDEPGAVSEVLAGLALAAESGAQVGAPGLLALLAEVYLATAQLADARGAVEAALAVGAQTGQLFWDADLHRLQGEIVLAAGGAPAGAAALFHRALDIARMQEAKSFELRAALSLSRLWRDQDKGAEARDLLAPLLAWFVEGFETGDLVEARALRAELG